MCDDDDGGVGQQLLNRYKSYPITMEQQQQQPQQQQQHWTSYTHIHTQYQLSSHQNGCNH